MAAIEVDELYGFYCNIMLCFEWISDFVYFQLRYIYLIVATYVSNRSVNTLPVISYNKYAVLFRKDCSLLYMFIGFTPSLHRRHSTHLNVRVAHNAYI